jgi:uncharacterized protein (TIGR00251 family)
MMGIFLEGLAKCGLSLSRCEENKDQIVIRINVQVSPGASKEKARIIAGEGILKVHLHARAVEGAANKALVEFLSDALGIAKSMITIEKGETSRKKVICLMHRLNQGKDESFFLEKWRKILKE